MAWKPFSSKKEKHILAAIANAEERCSGEIRVHIDEYCKGDPVFKAKNIFGHLEMDKTAQRNGVLIYVALKDHKFSIIGDEGIDAKVEDDFWDCTRDKMLEKLKQGLIIDAIIAGVENAGEQLSKYFPPSDEHGNELSDEITYGS